MCPPLRCVQYRLERRLVFYSAALDVVNRVLNGLDALGILIRNLEWSVVATEFLFDSHDQFHHVKRVSIEVLGERGAGLHFIELLSSSAMPWP